METEKVFQGFLLKFSADLKCLADAASMQGLLQIQEQHQKSTDTEKSRKRNRILECKNTAKRRKIKWEISDETAMELLHQACAYCNVYEESIRHRSIDRIQSGIRSYRDDNVAPCCRFCNHAKSTMSVYEHMQNLYKRLQSTTVTLQQVQHLCVKTCIECGEEKHFSNFLPYELKCTDCHKGRPFLCDTTQKQKRLL